MSDPWGWLDEDGGGVTAQPVDSRGGSKDPWAWLDPVVKKQDEMTKARITREKAEARVAQERAGGGAGQLAGDLGWQFARGTPPGPFLDEAVAYGTSLTTGRPYEDELAYQRAYARAQDAESPVIYKDAPLVGDITVGGAAKLAGGVVGGLGVAKGARAIGGPVAAPFTAGSTPTRTAAKVAGSGATGGAVYGFGEGEGSFGNRASNAALGAAVGSVAAPLIGAATYGVTRGGQIARDWARGRSPAVKGYTPKAVEEIRGAVERDDLALGPATSDRLRARTGPQGMLLDTGDNVKGLAQGAIVGNTQAKTAVRQAIRDRAADSSKRITKAINSAMGAGKGFNEAVDEVYNTASQTFTPAYKSFANTQIKWSPATTKLVEKIRNIPAFQSLVDDTWTAVQNSPRYSAQEIKNGGIFLDKLRGTLDDIGYGRKQATTFISSTQQELARDLSRQLNRAIDGEMQRAGRPGLYKSARDSYAGFANYRDGAKEGLKLLNNPNVTSYDVRKMLKGKRPEYAQGLRDAQRESIRVAMARAKSVYGSDAASQREAANALRELSNPAAREKLIAMGFKPKQVKEMLSELDAEATYLRTNADVLSGSQTAERTEMAKRFPRRVEDRTEQLRAASGATTTGFAKEAGLRTFYKLFEGEINEGIEKQAGDMARMLVSQGAERDRIIAAVRQITQQRVKDAATRRRIVRNVVDAVRGVDAPITPIVGTDATSREREN